MGQHKDSTASAVRNKINAASKNSIFFVTDFLDLKNPETVTRELSRLASQGVVIRIAKGIYLKPTVTQFGIVYPSSREIAETIARRDGARIFPTGETLLNEFGLSEQVPMNSIYITDGTPRQIVIGKHTITLRRGAPRNFAYKYKGAPYIVSILKALGKEQVTEEVIGVIRMIIGREKNPSFLLDDLKLAPIWIQKIVLPLIP